MFTLPPNTETASTWTYTFHSREHLDTIWATLGKRVTSRPSELGNWSTVMTSVNAPPKRGTNWDWLSVRENSKVPLLSFMETAIAGGELQGSTVNPVDSPRTEQVSESQASFVRQVGLDDAIPDRALQVVAVSAGEVMGLTGGEGHMTHKCNKCLVPWVRGQLEVLMGTTV